MPRRAPSEIRIQLNLRSTRTVISGLSASANHQVMQYEVLHGYRPGAVAHALRSWSSAARHLPCSTGPHAADGFHGGNGLPHARTLLERVLHALRGPARRELRAVLDPVDALYAASTLNDPSAPADRLWWERRIEN